MSDFPLGNCVIEFDIAGLDRSYCTLSADTGVVGCNGKRESLVYSVQSSTMYPAPVGLIRKLIPFTMLEKLDEVVWKLADACTAAEYWMLAYLVDTVAETELAKRIPVVRERSGRLLVRLPKGAELGLTQYIGCGNMDGFHLFAVPPAGLTDLVFRDIAASTHHHHTIATLSMNDDFCAADSFFEVRTYGFEDRDHVEIVCSDHVPRSLAQEIVRCSYGFPYFTARLSSADFEKWDDTHVLPPDAVELSWQEGSPGLPSPPGEDDT